MYLLRTNNHGRMKIFLFFFFLLVSALTTALGANDDIRGKVSAQSHLSGDLEIDPDAGVGGVPFGVSENDFVKAHGKPAGYVHLNTNTTLLVYGKDCGLIFRGGKLTGVRIANSILDWKLTSQYQDGTCRQLNWKLSNGIRMEMNLAEIRGLLGDKLIAQAGSLYRHSFATTNARVELEFSHWEQEGTGEEAYKLYGIYIEHGARGSGTGRVMIVNSRGAIPYFSSNPAILSAVDAVNRMAREMRRLKIDPDDAIYDAKLGTSEEKFIKIYGPPDGYVQLSHTDTAMLYGQSHGFVFRDGKLAGVRITRNILEWTLATQAEDTSPFLNREWNLDNGIQPEMNAGEVRKILGDKLKSSGDHYHRNYVTAKSRVELDFSHYSNEGEGENAYKIYGIHISPVSADKPKDQWSRTPSFFDRESDATKSIAVTTDKVLRVEATDGAVALIQFFGFTMDSEKGEDTTTYRWRFKASPSSPILGGTNTTVYRYTRKQTGANTYQLAAKDGDDAKRIKVGTFRLDWSYGYTNRGFIYLNRATDKGSVVERTGFETGP
jgi:hypothetical protein